MNNKIPALFLFCSMGLLMNCTPSPRFTTRPQPNTSAEMTASTNTDTESVPLLSTRYTAGDSFIGVASYYGPKFHGRKTANGETFDMYGITAAHKTLPFNTVIRVTHLATNQSTLVRINDRGPFIPGRMLDLSYGAARKIGLVTPGTGEVQVEIVELGDNQYAR